MSTRRCWAEQEGGCEGPLTREHVVSECLLEGQAVRVRGLAWCQGEFRPAGIGGPSCKCLCDKHNNTLSPVDGEAKRLLEALTLLLESKGGGQSNNPRIDGHRFGRWLAKTACNQAAANERHIPTRLIRYAFAERDDSTIRIYGAYGRGSHASIGLNHVGSYWLHGADNPESVAINIPFFGFPFILSTFSLLPFWPDVASLLRLDPDAGIMLMDRIARLDFADPGGSKGAIHFEWDNSCREAGDWMRNPLDI